MRFNKYGYSARNSVIAGLGSLFIYLLCVVFGVGLAWDRAFRNGEPLIPGLTEADRQAASLQYRDIFLMWMFAFAVLCVLLYLMYWNMGKAPYGDAEQRQRETKATMWACISLALSFLGSYARNAFVSRNVQVFGLLEVGIAIMYAVGLCLVLWHYIQKHLSSRAKPVMGDPANPPQPKGSAAPDGADNQPGMLTDAINDGVQATRYTPYMPGRFVRVASTVLNLLSNAVIPLVFGLPNTLAWISSVLGLFVMPEPFRLVTCYDSVLWLIPLVGLILFAFNLKMNAHPNVGLKRGTGGKWTTSLYTMAAFAPEKEA